ncbi:MAG: PAS domain S-box protein, partial [Actinobacteria bacterium]|nr:PAS domain S-box protein [Actinomycetota bacterium]
FGFSPDGTITFANEVASSILGCPVDDLVGRPATRFIAALADHDPAGNTMTIETVVERTDGSTFPGEFGCSPIRERDVVVGTVVSFRDITARKRMENERERAASLVAATLESTADGILVVDATGKLTSFNRKFVEMWSIPDEIVDRGSDDEALTFVLDQLDDPDAFVGKVRELYAHPHAESFDELHFRDGRTFERYSKPQKVAGSTVGRVWSFRDVTERHRLDEMKNSFLSAVSHELRTPLTSVLGYALTLEQSGDAMPAADREQVLGRLAVNARKLQRLLEDALDLDRLSRGMLAPKRAPTLVRDLMVRMIEESGVADDRPVVVDIEPIIASIDGPKVERIVENLLRNAARHTSSGTRVAVRARARDGGLLISVEDSGAGVPDDLKRTIFLPFQQGSEVNKHAPGVGIGLALVARFADLHGGSAWVEDGDAGGACFNVYLPCDVVSARRSTTPRARRITPNS